MQLQAKMNSKKADGRTDNTCMFHPHRNI